MLYFSQDALNEIDDVRHSESTTTTLSLTKVVGGSRATQSKIESPGSGDKVDFALRRARKQDRKVHRDVRSLHHTGSIFDLRVAGLKIGVMPFLGFGERGEHTPNKVRTFWAQAFVQSSRFRSRSYEIILVGSLNRVVNESWTAREDELKIGHAYPSDPSVLSFLIQRELGLTGSDIQGHLDEVCAYEDLEEGCYARFASEQTARAQECVIDSDSYAPSWERRRPAIRKARVVGIVNDTSNRIVLARPVLVQDLT